MAPLASKTPPAQKRARRTVTAPAPEPEPEAAEDDAAEADEGAAAPEEHDPLVAPQLRADGPPGPVVRPAIEVAQTPLLKQYLAIKEKHKDDVLLYRMGDFYELFFDDAEIVSKALGIAITARGTGADAYAFAGFPVHAVDRYLPRLIAQGFRVAICEQTEDPALARGKRIVERAVVEVITPGTLTDEKLLEARAANFLLAVCLPRARSRTVGLAWFEASSGRFLVAEVERERVDAELARIAPAELLVSESLAKLGERGAGDEGGEPSPDAKLYEALRRRAPVSVVEDWVWRPQGALDVLKQRLGVATLGGLGLDDRAAYVPAAHAALWYVGQKKPGFLEKLERFGRGVELWRPDEHLALDAATARCLELVSGLREAPSATGTGARGTTLFGALDRTRTAMGSRLLREWLLAPLRQVEPIVRRHDAVEALVQAPAALEALTTALSSVYDLERLAGRAASGRASARDMAALRDSLSHLPATREAARAAARARGEDGGLLREVADRLDSLDDLRETLSRALVDRPALSPGDGPIIASGWSSELDQLRADAGDVDATLAAFQAREVERTGIASMKIGYNRVFGYYLEVSQANRHRVPDDYIRKQTLKHCERFLTAELKELEGRVLSARERAEALEAQLLGSLREACSSRAAQLLASAGAAATLDVLGALATLARERGYCRPTVADHAELKIVAGRHPVLDVLEGSERFVPNDVALGGAEAGWVHVLTGPNMAGKSTFIRQAALLVLLAQAGSFVPAERCEVGLVDRIFARVGAGDELAQGLSTFMVEMTETANILRHATARSLVILDEVGRGTSTYDGVSLAWAIAEFLHEHVEARTLFATHYHELTGLAAEAPGVRNWTVAVEERGHDVFFLHRVVPGAADRSYGIHVARLAGVPAAVLARAQVILRGLEAGTFEAARGATSGAPPEAQLDLFPPKEDPLRQRLAAVDVQRTTPLEALLLLEELKRLQAVEL